MSDDDLKKLTSKKAISDKGRFSVEEEEFIRQNYMFMTDAEIARQLGRKTKAIANKRERLGLNNKREMKKKPSRRHRVALLSSLDESEKEKFYLSELRKSPWYKHVKSVLNPSEFKFYEDKYVNFMLDPTIETMTVAERDALHQMTIAQIRSLRFMREEQQARLKGDDKFNRAREISECDTVVQKCQESLNTQRKQRLKNQGDQAINLTQMIKELKDPAIRREVGYQAAMFKYMGEKDYNDHLGSNILSGQDEEFDLSIIFKDGVVPSGLGSNFFERYDEGQE
jgi:hypothetical protein